MLFFGGHNEIMLSNGYKFIESIDENEINYVKDKNENLKEIKIKKEKDRKMLSISFVSESNQHGTQLTISDFKYKVGDTVKFNNSNTVWTVTSIKEIIEDGYQIFADCPIQINNFQFDSF